MDTPVCVDLERQEIPACLTPASGVTKIVTLIAILLPFAGLVAGIILLWEHDFSGRQLAVFIAMYLLTGWCVTLAYHRLFTHASFQTILPVKIGLAILGSMAVQGPLLKWVATHRRHHQHSDTPDDPHSPHMHGQGF